MIEMQNGTSTLLIFITIKGRSKVYHQRRKAVHGLHSAKAIILKQASQLFVLINGMIERKETYTSSLN